MNIGGCTGEKRGPSIDLFSQMILALIDDSCAILRLDVKKRKLRVDFVKLAEIAISPDFARCDYTRSLPLPMLMLLAGADKFQW